MDLESLYQEIILDHYRHPHHKGLREPFDAQVHHVNPTCGDEITLRVELKDAGGEPEIADVSYDSLGCSISQASASVMADLVIGRPVSEAMEIEAEFRNLMRSEGEPEVTCVKVCANDDSLRPNDLAICLTLRSSLKRSLMSRKAWPILRAAR